MVAICSPAESPKTPSWFQSTQAFKTHAVGPPAVTVSCAVLPGVKGLVKVTGTLSLNRTDPETYLFRVTDARIGEAD